MNDGRRCQPLPQDFVDDDEARIFSSPEIARGGAGRPDRQVEVMTTVSGISQSGDKPGLGDQ